MARLPLFLLSLSLSLSLHLMAISLASGTVFDWLTAASFAERRRVEPWPTRRDYLMTEGGPRAERRAPPIHSLHVMKEEAQRAQAGLLCKRTLLSSIGLRRRPVGRAGRKEDAKARPPLLLNMRLTRHRPICPTPSARARSSHSDRTPAYANTQSVLGVKSAARRPWLNT